MYQIQPMSVMAHKGRGSTSLKLLLRTLKDVFETVFQTEIESGYCPKSIKVFTLWTSGKDKKLVISYMKMLPQVEEAEDWDHDRCNTSLSRLLVLSMTSISGKAKFLQLFHSKTSVTFTFKLIHCEGSTIYFTLLQ